MMNFGFTGTQNGMTPLQKKAFWQFLRGYHSSNIIKEFHHGDCEGADKEAHDMAVYLGVYVVVHPPENSLKRAWCSGNREEKPLPYLKRNTEIVKACDMLIATPKEQEEVLRSGTWATIRRARKQNKPYLIICPEGKETGFLGMNE